LLLPHFYVELTFFMICGEGVIRVGVTVANLAWELYPLVALPAFAMGLQNAALRRVGGRIVPTTYVTGMLTELAEAGVEDLYWLRDRSRGAMGHRVASATRAATRQTSLKMMLLGSGIWAGVRHRRHHWRLCAKAVGVEIVAPPAVRSGVYNRARLASTYTRRPAREYTGLKTRILILQPTSAALATLR
jgi:hypothetical protein